MPEYVLITFVRIAGVCQLLTLVGAHFTPVPRDWNRNLAGLPEVHRRFAHAQNVFIGAVIASLGTVSLALAPDLVTGTATARAWCAATALWWGGRLCTLPLLRAWPELHTRPLRIGFVLLHIECTVLGIGFAWLALR